MYNLSDIESQVTDEGTRQALLSVLRARIAKLQESEPASGTTKVTTKNSADFGDFADSTLQPQSLPPETQLRSSETGSLADDFGDAAHDTPDCAKTFAAALDKLDPDLREIAADLYEHLHHKSKFASLTSLQREAIVELLQHHKCEDVARIIAQPPPIGLNFHTSAAGVVRFRRDYLRCAMQHRRDQSEQAAEREQLAFEESFKAANASDDSFRTMTQSRIRKRLFRAVNDPGSDYHEIRWLIKSLEMLRTSTAMPESCNAEP